MVNGTAGINYRIQKANRTDGRVQNLAVIIERFLKAGIMENGKYVDTERGTPQGNGASPVLANIYLHHVLDLWFEIAVKKKMKGQCYLIRYADDFVCCFEKKHEAEIFMELLKRRFGKFGLELAEEKTKLLEFGRFAKRDRERRGEGKPETFDFLGFTFYCGQANKDGFFRCRVKTSKKKFRSKLKAMKEWIKSNRHMRLKDLFKTLSPLSIHFISGYDSVYSLNIGSRKSAASLLQYFEPSRKATPMRSLVNECILSYNYVFIPFILNIVKSYNNGVSLYDHKFFKQMYEYLFYDTSPLEYIDFGERKNSISRVYGLRLKHKDVTIADFIKELCSKKAIDILYKKSYGGDKSAFQEGLKCVYYLMSGLESHIS